MDILSGVSSAPLGFPGGRPPSRSPLRVGPTAPSFPPPLRSSVVAFWRPRKKKEAHSIDQSRPPKAKAKAKAKTPLDDFMEEEEEEYVKEEEEFEEEEEEEGEEFSEEDALEAFFSQLEKDINSHDLSHEDVEIKDEDVAKFEKEVALALGEGELEEVDLDSEGIEGEDLIRLPKLKTWQMRKLARALKIGRRKASIKKLSEDVGLDRATVLEFLRNPPPSLVLMSDSLPDEPSPQPPSEPETIQIESSIPNTSGAEVKSKETQLEVKHPARPVRQSPQKRLKRVQVETLERVYSRTKRPTNDMISSIVHVTNLPRKTVVKWFEEKRVQDGVPHQPLSRATYQREHVAHTVSTR